MGASVNRVWRFLSDYALVIVVMLVAGAVTGGCAILETRPPQGEIMIRARDCRDSQPIRFMPNWIRQWDPPHIDRWT